MDIKSLISKYSAAEDEFTIEFDKDAGEVFRFKAIRSFAELQAMQSSASKAYKVLKGKTCSEALKPFADVDEATFGCAYVIANTLVEPKWSLADTLNLANNAGFFFNALFDQANKKQMAITSQNDEDHIDDIKND